MAAYDLKCRSCGKEFEVFLRGFLRDEDRVCPECRSSDVEQRFTGFGGFTGLGVAAQSCFSNCQPSACPAGGGCNCACSN